MQTYRQIENGGVGNVQTFFSCPFCRQVQEKAGDTREVVVDGVMRLACGSHFAASPPDSEPPARMNGHAGTSERWPQILLDAGETDLAGQLQQEMVDQ